MSRLDELIQKLCPDGVDYKTIASCTIKNDNIKWKNTNGEEYEYIDLSSVDRGTHQITETQTINSDTAPSRAQQIINSGDILFGATRPMLKRYCMVDSVYDNQICSTGFTVLRVDENAVLRRWLYHIIASNDFFAYVEQNQKGASYPAISDKLVKEYMLPVPPLEVQREIVHILDSFALLTAELTAELTARKKQYEYYRNELLKPKANIPMVRLDVQKRYAEVLDNFEKICNDLNIGLPAEIEARQKQYEFYRDALLTYAETGKIILTDRHTYRQADRYNALIRLCQYVFGFVMLPLCEICSSISSGKAKTKDDIGKYPVYGSTGIIARTDNAVYNKMNILVARVGANAGYTHLAQGGYDVSDNTLIVDVKSEYSLKYIYYQLVNIGLNRYAKGGGQPLVTAGQIKEVVLPVPMKQEQDRIVEILDRFDNLCNDLNSGLPAEIEARQKQYEFYRDKLLSFKQL